MRFRGLVVVAVGMFVLIFGDRAMAATVRIDRIVTHETGGMEAVQLIACPAGTPAGSACALVTEFDGDLRRVFADRADEPVRELRWSVKQFLCVDGQCGPEEILWDMGIGGRHDTTLSDRRGFVTKRLCGMKGCYIFQYAPTSAVQDFSPDPVDEPRPPCITRFFEKRTGFSSEGVATLTIIPTGGAIRIVNGEGFQEYLHREKHVTRIKGCQQ